MKNAQLFNVGNTCFAPTKNPLDTTDASHKVAPSDSISHVSPATAQSSRIQRAFGATSHQIVLKRDPTAKYGGGTMNGCLTNQYEKNFLMEAALNELRFRERKPRKLKFNEGARTTKTADARARTT